MLPPSEVVRCVKTGIQSGSYTLHIEDRVSMFLRNIGNTAYFYTVLASENRMNINNE
jgi:hypothetical protein